MEGEKARAIVYACDWSNRPEHSRFASCLQGEEERADAKLFIGMIAKTCTEAELRQTFAPYGDIEEVYIMKDKATGREFGEFNARILSTSHLSDADNTAFVWFSECKGCAFVKYSTKSEATRAIDGLHGKVTMPGNQNPLVVKWADPPKDPAKNMMANQVIFACAEAFFGGARYRKEDCPSWLIPCT
jgi:RNA recognition motif-containing protein